MQRLAEQLQPLRDVVGRIVITSSYRTEAHNDDIIARIDRFSRAIAEKYNPERILLFGSYANDCPNADSDVAILVVFPGNGDVADRSCTLGTALHPAFPLDLFTRSP